MGINEFWRHVLQQWDRDTAVDLHQFFGIDLLDRQVLRQPWWWLRTRIRGLVQITDSRLARWVSEASE